MLLIVMSNEAVSDSWPSDRVTAQEKKVGAPGTSTSYGTLKISKNCIFHNKVCYVEFFAIFAND